MHTHTDEQAGRKLTCTTSHACRVARFIQPHTSQPFFANSNVVVSSIRCLSITC